MTFEGESPAVTSEGLITRQRKLIISQSSDIEQNVLFQASKYLLNGKLIILPKF